MKGEIELFGKRVNSKNRIELLMDIGSLIESPSYYGHLTARENLKIFAALLDVPNANIDKVLQFVGMFGWTKEIRMADVYFGVMDINWFFFGLWIGASVVPYLTGRYIFCRKEV